MISEHFNGLDLVNQSQLEKAQLKMEDNLDTRIDKVQAEILQLRLSQNDSSKAPLPQPVPQVIQQTGIQQSALDDMELKIMDKIS